MVKALTVPTTELGNGAVNTMPWDGFSDSVEDVPELKFPQSIITYDHIRNDSQIEALMASITVPLLRYKWRIKPNGARDEVVEHIARDMNLPISGADEEAPLGRMRNRFSHWQHMNQAFLALLYGFMPFAQVAPKGEDGKYHLKKLAPRMPRTIQGIDVARDGGLLGVRQYPDPNGRGFNSNPMSPAAAGGIYNLGQIEPIGVNALVMYTNKKEGANWYGRSLLRTAYKHAILKDKLMRIDTIKHERNGMGLPEYEAPPGAPQSIIDALTRKAEALRAGQYAGGASPAGSKLRLVGVEGSLPDTVASIRMHDEAMARSFLAMFLQLGQTNTGSRALGASFVDFFTLSLDYYAKWYQDITNEHVVEDIVDWNYSIDENAPLLVYERDDSAELPIADMVSLISAGALVVDPPLERHLRERYSLPTADKTFRAEQDAKDEEMRQHVLNPPSVPVAGQPGPKNPDNKGKTTAAERIARHRAAALQRIGV